MLAADLLGAALGVGGGCPGGGEGAGCWEAMGVVLLLVLRGGGGGGRGEAAAEVGEDHADVDVAFPVFALLLLASGFGGGQGGGLFFDAPEGGVWFGREGLLGHCGLEVEVGRGFV